MVFADGVLFDGVLFDGVLFVTPEPPPLEPHAVNKTIENTDISNF